MADTTDDQKSYYEYNPAAGGSWWRKAPPLEDPAFQKGLTEFAGLNPHGQPILKVSWGGTLLHDYTVKPQLKYKITASRVKGFYYQATDGTTKWIRSMNLAKDAIVPWQFYEDRETLELGRLRWVVESWESAESLEKKGRFKNTRSPDGEKILRDLPREGVYNHFFWIQDAKRRFRNLDAEVLTAVQAMWQYEITAQEAQAGLDAIDAQNQQTIIGAEEARQVWNQLPQE
jgi:hypothetical protein